MHLDSYWNDFKQKQVLLLITHALMSTTGQPDNFSNNDKTSLKIVHAGI